MGAADVVGFDASGNVSLDTTNSGWRTTWDVIVAGDFVGNGCQQILLYDRNAGEADVVGFDAAGTVNLDTTNSGWRTTWDVIVAGDFVGNGCQQILLYDRNAGEADVVGFDASGTMNLDTTNGAWRTTWDVIVVGDFVGNGRQQVLLYDRNAGEADVVGFDASGNMNLDTTNSGWRTAWDAIVVGDFVGNGRQQIALLDRFADEVDVVGFDDSGNENLDATISGSNGDGIVSADFLGIGRDQILRYDRALPAADVFGVDAGGNLALDVAVNLWRANWDLVVTGDFLGNGMGQALLYDRTSGQADIYGPNAQGNMDRLLSLEGWRTTWDTIVVGNFVGNGSQQLLLYDRGSRGQAQSVLPNGALLASHANWRTTWSHIVAGRFSAAAYDGLLFYEQNSGHAEFYETDGQGGTAFLASHDDWRTTWTHIISGKFSNSEWTGLLFYDQSAGFVEVYDTDGHGNLIKLSDHDGWHGSWTHITTVRVPGSPYSAIVLYDQGAGRGEVLRCTGSGNFELYKASDGWRTSWTHVVGTLQVTAEPASGGNLLFYEASTGHCEIYTITNAITEPPDPTDENAPDDLKLPNDPNVLGLMAESDAVPPATHIVAGSFGWGSEFVFYDRSSGAAHIIRGGGATLIEVDGEAYSDWRTTWDVIVPGDFWVADEEDHHFVEGGFTDLLFYDRSAGYGEFYLHEPPVSTPSRALEGYVSAGSVRAGNAIEFFVSSQVGPYTIDVYRQSADLEFVTNVPVLPRTEYSFATDRSAWRDGAQWEPVASLTIPSDWPSGVYFARVTADPADPVDIPFIVRAALDGSQSRILVVMNDTTYDAYNHWGGRSLYGFGSHGTLYFTAPGSGATTLPWGFRVSFRRPLVSFFPEYNQKWAYWEVPLIRWLARQEIPVEWCTLVDLHNDSVLLDHYNLIVNVGHAEYISKEMHDNIVTFVDSGGNAAFSTGNTCWWRVRLEDNGNAMTCYKCLDEVCFDPITEPSTITGRWSEALATKLTGVSYDHGRNFAGDPSLRRDSDGNIPQYVVTDSAHWVFAGTGLTNCSLFGAYDNDTKTVVGAEVDRKSDPPPSGFTTLAAVMDAGEEAATMGVSSREGTVFTASTMDWTLGLSQDSGWGPIDQITLNLLQGLNPDWSQRNLSKFIGAPAVAGDPTVYVDAVHDTLQIIYRRHDGHIHELWWDAVDGWGGGDLTAVTGTPNAAGDPAGYVFEAQGTQHVVYRGVDGHIHELWWDEANGWGGGDLTAVTGTPNAAGDPAGYVFEAQGTQHVVYRGIDGHIHELWWDEANGWGGGDLTAVTGNPNAAGDPAGYVFEAQGTQHVVYRGVDRHIHELWWDEANGWGGGDLTAVTRTPDAASNPAGYVFQAQGTQHVVYRGVDEHIHELWWDATNGWGGGDLTAATGSSDAAGDPAGYMFEAQGTQHVVYRGVDGHIHELWWDEENGWGGGDLTAVSRSPVAVSNSSGVAFDAQGTQHVVFAGAGGQLHALRWG